MLLNTHLVACVQWFYVLC